MLQSTSRDDAPLDDLDAAPAAAALRLALPKGRMQDGVFCLLADAGVPVTVVRGVSNVAGQRDRSSWKVEEALGAAVELVHGWLQ